MGTVYVNQLNFRPVAFYFVAALLLLAGTLAWQGLNRRAAVLAAIKNGIFHPVQLPIIIGLLFAQTGLVLPEVVGKPLHLLGSAFGPTALVLVGVTLTQVPMGPY